MIYLLAFILGCVNVISKTVNYQASEHLGTANGSLVNYVTASILSFLLALWLELPTVQPQVFANAPAWCYFGGVFGLFALLINVTSLKKINLFQSTTILLLGQLFGSAFLDLVLFQSMSWLKVCGLIGLWLGVLWDQRVAMGK